MSYSDEVKQRAYALDPECWVSYAGKPKEVRRAIDQRRTASLQQAALECPEPADTPATCDWISTADELPDDETPVLIVHNGAIAIGELRWEHPSYEETHPPFRYWDDPNNDGQDWDWCDVTHWMPLPSLPV